MPTITITSPLAGDSAKVPVQVEGTVSDSTAIVRGSMTDANNQSHDPTSITQPSPNHRTWSMTFGVPAMHNPYSLKVWYQSSSGISDQHDGITVTT
jgi:hypothetical protein